VPHGCAQVVLESYRHAGQRAGVFTGFDQRIDVFGHAQRVLVPDLDKGVQSIFSGGDPVEMVLNHLSGRDFFFADRLGDFAGGAAMPEVGHHSLLFENPGYEKIPFVRRRRVGKGLLVCQ
jgi:hypothetical protein